jgi:anti-anti-sigma regulatory factor
MIAIQKSGEGKYAVSFRQQTDKIDRISGYQLKKEVGKILREHREIIVNLKGIQSMDNHGYKMLQELVELTAKRKCTIHFKNAEGEIKHKIDSLEVTF